MQTKSWTAYDPWRRRICILRSGTTKVDRPKKTKFLVGFYSKDELAALFEATKEDSMAAVIQLAAYYGLRRSEALGIRWSAVDFVHGTPSINHKVTEGKVDERETLFIENKLKRPPFSSLSATLTTRITLSCPFFTHSFSICFVIKPTTCTVGGFPSMCTVF